MQEQDGLNADQRDLENVLRSLSPAQAKLNPIAAAFEAGRMVHRRQVRVLSTISVMSILIAAGSVIWMQRPAASSPSTPIAIAPEPESKSQAISSPSAPTLIALQQAVQSRGVDALPATAVPKVNVNNPL